MYESRLGFFDRCEKLGLDSGVDGISDTNGVLDLTWTGIVVKVWAIGGRVGDVDFSCLDHGDVRPFFKDTLAK